VDKPKFFTTPGGINYKILDFEESEDIPKIGDYLSLYTSYLTKNDSAFYSSVDFKFNKMEFHHLQEAEEGTYEEVLSELQVGDSAVVTIETENFFKNYLEAEVPSFLADELEIYIHLRLIKSQSYDDYIKERENEKDLMELKELTSISNYLKVTPMEFIESSGIQISVIESDKDSTSMISFGELVELHYTGEFIENGNVFYSTARNGFPDEFSFGRQGQLIRGLEIALSGKLFNDSIEVLIPSAWAFGENGSAGGIVPPYTALKYNIRIRKPVIKTDDPL
jgi:FKBP-type peptidyl-prolyl cis-trans isomerase